MTTYSIKLADVVKIGSTESPVSINGTTRTVSGLSNTVWDPKNNQYSTSTKAATEAQLQGLSENIDTNSYKGWKLSTGTGSTSHVDSEDIVNFSSNDNNISISNNETNVLFKLNTDLTGMTSITMGAGTGGTGTSQVQLTKNGLSNGGYKITNVKAGEADTDAVNVSQLNSKTAAATTEVKAGTNVASVNKDTKTPDGHTIYTVNANGTKVTGDSNVVVTAGTKDANNMTTYSVKLADVVKIGSTESPVSINGTTRTVSGLSNTVWDPKNNQYSTSTKAATEAQLQGLSENIDTNSYKGWKLSTGKGSTSHVDSEDTVNFSSNDNNISISNNETNVLFKLNTDLTGMTSITMGAGTGGTSPVQLTTTGLSNGGYTITNVKAGEAGTDAVNVSQLNSKTAAATTEVKAGTNVASVDKNTNTPDGHTIYTVNANGTKVTGDSNVAVTASTNNTTNMTTYSVKLAEVVKIGSTTGSPVSINGKTGTVSGLSNTVWDPKNNQYSTSTKAATEAQLQGLSENIDTNSYKGWKLSTGKGSTSPVDSEAIVDFSSNDNNISISNTGTNVLFKLNTDLTGMTSITMGAGTGGTVSSSIDYKWVE
jgi:hypothetical protein